MVSPSRIAVTEPRPSAAHPSAGRSRTALTANLSLSEDSRGEQPASCRQLLRSLATVSRAARDALFLFATSWAEAERTRVRQGLLGSTGRAPAVPS